MASRRLAHVPALDGLRGVAILMVAAAHSLVPSYGWPNFGTLGVDVFFVLSGFLITTLLLEEWAATGTISLARFYRRRARRLLPALLTITGAAALILLAAHPAVWEHTLVAFAARISYAGNLLLAFTSFGVGGDRFNHLWSLAEEEQFYLLWPFLLIFLLRRNTRPRTMLLLLTVAIAAVNIDRLITLRTDPGRVWVSPDTHGDPILYGAAAAILRHYRIFCPGRAAQLAAAPVFVGSLAWYEIASPRIGPPDAYPVTMLLLCLSTSVLILAVAARPATRLAGMLATAPLRYAGRISYGWYLWNSPIISFFGPAGGLISCAIAAGSFRWIEQPFLRGRRSARLERAESPSAANLATP